MNIERPIDNFGRIVLPRAYRDALGLTEKSTLRITLHNSCIVLEDAQSPLNMLEIKENSQ